MLHKETSSLQENLQSFLQIFVNQDKTWWKCHIRHMPNLSGAPEKTRVVPPSTSPPTASASRWAAVCTLAAIYNEEINQWEMVLPALIIQPESISVCVSGKSSSSLDRCPSLKHIHPIFSLSHSHTHAIHTLTLALWQSFPFPWSVSH